MENTVEIKDEITGRVIKLSKDDYEMIAAYVRAKDRHDYAVDVIMNGITGQYGDLINVENFIINNEEKVDKFSLELNEGINGITGETEYGLTEKWIRKEQPNLYRVISNEGTEDELEDEVILSSAQAEAINAGTWKGTLLTTLDTEISTEFITRMEYVAPYDMD